MSENKNVNVVATEPSSTSQETQSVMSRVSNLPLVSSACGAVSGIYSSTKENVPALRGVMGAAESGVRTLSTAASSGSRPILDKLEPQIAMVNEYAIKGLDKMEEKLPILHQPADKLVERVYQCVSGATEAMMGAVVGGVEMTRAALGGSRGTQTVDGGVGLALTGSEDRVEQNLPLTEKELSVLAEPLPQEEASSAQNPGAPPDSPRSYYVRLGKLSALVRERALELSLIKACMARDATHRALSQITSTLDLLENLGPVASREQLLKRWREWKEEEKRVEDGPGGGADGAKEDGEKDNPEQLEGRALAMVRGLSARLGAACACAVSSVQGLPPAAQQQLRSARRAAEHLHEALRGSGSVTPALLEHSRTQLAQVRQSFDGVMEYLLNNTPLNWLVGPFSPQLTEKRPGEE